MISKKTITATSFLATLCLIIGVVIYVTDSAHWFRGELPNCIVMRSGNVRVEVHYHDAFSNESSVSVGIKKKEPSKVDGVADNYTLGIDAEGFSEPLSI